MHADASLWLCFRGRKNHGADLGCAFCVNRATSRQRIHRFLLNCKKITPEGLNWFWTILTPKFMLLMLTCMRITYRRRAYVERSWWHILVSCCPNQCMTDVTGDFLQVIRDFEGMIHFRFDTTFMYISLNVSTERLYEGELWCSRHSWSSGRYSQSSRRTWWLCERGLWC